MPWISIYIQGFLWEIITYPRSNRNGLGKPLLKLDMDAYYIYIYVCVCVRVYIYKHV